MTRLNYFEFVKLIEKVCLLHPLVETFYEGVYAIDASSNVKYPVIAMTVNSVQTDTQETTFNFNLLYADRLTDDRKNRLEIQSIAIDTIKEILNAIDWQNYDITVATSTTFIPFKEQFADLTAGAVAQNIAMGLPSNLGDCQWLCDFDYCDT